MDGLPFGPYSEVDMVCSNTHRRADWIVALVAKRWSDICCGIVDFDQSDGV
jgi:hypothetical protein